MTQVFTIHPHNPQLRLVKQAVDIIRSGGVVVYPTDSAYGIGCGLGEKNALDRICRIRQLPDRHNFALMCKDLSELALYSKVDNIVFRLLKANTPGPYTFILKSTTEVPRLMMHPKRKTVGLRVPDHPIMQAILLELDEPLITSTLQLPGDEYPLTDPDEVIGRLGKQVDLVIDGGHGDLEPTTVVDLTGDEPQILREGKGSVESFV